VVRIDEELCDGCGLCVPSCAEGAIAIVDGKARLVSEVYCDGLGACLGHCPQGAIAVEQREAEPFDDAAVEAYLARISHRLAKRSAGGAGDGGVFDPTGAESGSAARRAPGGEKTSPALVHRALQPRGGEECGLAGSVKLAGAGPSMPVLGLTAPAAGGCPGTRPLTLPHVAAHIPEPGEGAPSALRHWPVQLHLVPPTAPFYRDADLLLAADCSAFAVGDFHGRFLAGRSLAIACPKLDVRQEVYLDKLIEMIDGARIRSLRVVVMEVACCTGLVGLAQRAVAAAARAVPVTAVTVSAAGAVIDERVL